MGIVGGKTQDGSGALIEGDRKRYSLEKVVTFLFDIGTTGHAFHKSAEPHPSSGEASSAGIMFLDMTWWLGTAFISFSGVSIV